MTAKRKEITPKPRRTKRLKAKRTPKKITPPAPATKDEAEAMAAPIGNRFWQARSKHGRNPIFAKPEDLWAAAGEYFDWIEANPLFEDKLVSFQGASTHERMAKMRAMTITGLCIFLDISMQAWTEYGKRKGFGDICTRIAEIIRTQKFTGAAADLLNANIIAREIGLADKHELTGADGGPMVTETVARPPITRDEWLALYGGGAAPKTKPKGDRK